MPPNHLRTSPKYSFSGTSFWGTPKYPYKMQWFWPTKCYSWDPYTADDRRVVRPCRPYNCVIDTWYSDDNSDVSLRCSCLLHECCLPHSVCVFHKVWLMPKLFLFFFFFPFSPFVEIIETSTSSPVTSSGQCPHTLQYAWVLSLLCHIIGYLSCQTACHCYNCVIVVNVHCSVIYVCVSLIGWNLTSALV